MENVSRPQQAFTLIELLMVVAIIAVLAAIAIPNLLEAQTRARIGRVQSDLRTLSTAAHVYRLDNGKPPVGTPIPGVHPVISSEGFVRYALSVMTTPVSYISSLPADPFIPRDAATDVPGREIGFIYHLWQNHPSWATSFNDPGWEIFRHCVGGSPFTWALHSQGPSGPTKQGDYTFVAYIPYDATNGTVSNGSITRAEI